MRIINKTRYEIPYAGSKIELDVYGGDLSGFLSAEVEFQSAAGQQAFVPPSWFGTNSWRVEARGAATSECASDTLICR